MKTIIKTIAMFVASFGFVSAVALASPAAALNITKQGSVDSSTLTNKANKKDDLTTIIGRVISTLFLLLGILAVIVIIIAGIRFATANGDAGAVKSARDTIVYACIGLVVAIMSYAIVQFVLSRFGSNGQ